MVQRKGLALAQLRGCAHSRRAPVCALALWPEVEQLLYARQSCSHGAPLRFQH